MSTSRKQWTKAIKTYRKWRDDCVKAFENSGVACPLFADRGYPIFIHTRAYYGGNVHCDPGNTNKGCMDAVFRDTEGPGDKYCGGSYDAPLYDEDNPRTEVELRGWILRKYPHLVS